MGKITLTRVSIRKYRKSKTKQCPVCGKFMKGKKWNSNLANKNI